MLYKLMKKALEQGDDATAQKYFYLAAAFTGMSKTYPSPEELAERLFGLAMNDITDDIFLDVIVEEFGLKREIIPKLVEDYQETMAITIDKLLDVTEKYTHTGGLTEDEIFRPLHRITILRSYLKDPTMIKNVDLYNRFGGDATFHRKIDKSKTTFEMSNQFWKTRFEISNN